MSSRHGGLGLALLSFLLAACGSDGSGSPGGSGGSGAQGGYGGFAGTAGTAGSGGFAGTAGTAGTAGSAGTAGTAGAAGSAGSDAGPTDGGSDAATDGGSDAATDGGSDAGATDAGSDAGSPGSRLIVSDGTSNKIFVLKLDGTVIDTFTSPVVGPRGVAWDRTKQDGYWVIGSADGTKIYKLDISGNPLTPLALKTSVNANSFRGLDYYADAAGDRLVFIFNNGIVAAVQAVDVSDGSTQLQSSHYKGGFLSGFWGVHVVGGSGSGGDLERWTSWSDGSLQRWVGSQNQAQVISTGLGTLRGLSVTPSGDFWVVAGSQIVHLDASGSTLGSIAAPSSDVRGLSYVE